MRVAVVGGGINGIMTAWALATHGAQVVVYDKCGPMAATSSASSRMLHGGIRYLENLQFGFVREALQERAWWIKNAPEHIECRRFHVPVRKGISRNSFVLRLGTWLYEQLAGKYSLGSSRWIEREELLGRFPQLRADGMKGAASYVDAIMDDTALGEWVVSSAREAGVRVVENAAIDTITTTGMIVFEAGRAETYDRVVNAAGPWATQLAEKSGIDLGITLALIRGIHLLMDWRVQEPLLLQTGDDGRVVFILPIGGRTLVGTTEVGVNSPDELRVSREEIAYLLNVLVSYFERSAADFRSRIVGSFAGIRPLVHRSGVGAGRLSRDHEIVETGKALHVLGGKWTTSRRLGMEVAGRILPVEKDVVANNFFWRIN